MTDYSYKITLAAQQSLDHIAGKRAEIGRRVSVLNKQKADIDMELQSWLEADALYKEKAAQIKTEGLR